MGTVAPEQLAAVLSQVSQSLVTYREELQALRPPAELAHAHQQMEEAITNLIASENDVIKHAAGVDKAALDSFRRNGDAIEAFEKACHVLTPTFTCGTLIESSGSTD